MHTVIFFHNMTEVKYLPQFPLLQIGYSSTQSSLTVHFPATFKALVVKILIVVFIVAIFIASNLNIIYISIANLYLITYQNIKIKPMEELHTFGVSISAYLVGSPVGRSS